MTGWYSMARGWQDNEIFGNDKFSRRDAWAWMIERACWEAKPYHVRGTMLTLERGQFCASRDQMAKAWGWSNSAVERFINRLKIGQMIGQETGQGKSIITLCNYDKYQTPNFETGQESEPLADQKPDSNRTANKQVNKKTNNTSYRFEGKTIKLNAEDFEVWERNYHTIPCLVTELLSIDGWFQKQTASVKKGWYYSTVTMLGKKQQEAIAAQRQSAKTSNAITI